MIHIAMIGLIVRRRTGKRAKPGKARKPGLYGINGIKYTKALQRIGMM
jgi:hypothetical protein